MKPALIVSLALLLSVSPMGAGEDEIVVIGGNSLSPLYLTGVANLPSELEQDVVSGKFLRHYASVHLDADLVGNVSVTVTINGDKGGQAENLHLLSFTFKSSGIKKIVAKDYKDSVARYLDLRMKGFSYQYAVDLIFLKSGDVKVDREAKAITSAYTHANPLKLRLVKSEDYKDWLKKTYMISDGGFEWIYEIAVDLDGDVMEVQERREKRVR